MAKSSAKETVFSRAYVVPCDTEVLLDLCKSFNGHKFVDSKGNQSMAIVEFAPFQKWIDLGKKKQRVDHRMGTIGTDPDYLAFCESLNTPDLDFGGIDENDIEYLLSKKDNQPKSTPLLDSIKHEKEKRAAKKARKKELSSSGRLISKATTKPYSPQPAGQSIGSSKSARSEVVPAEPTSSSSTPSTKKKKPRNRTSKGVGVDSPSISGFDVALPTNSLSMPSKTDSNRQPSSVGADNGLISAAAVLKDGNHISSPIKTNGKFKLVKKKDQG